MKIGFIGLGNVGGKLAGSLLRNNFKLTVYDLDPKTMENLSSKAASISKNRKELKAMCFEFALCISNVMGAGPIFFCYDRVSPVIFSFLCVVLLSVVVVM